MTHNSSPTPLSGWGSLGICFFALYAPFLIQWMYTRDDHIREVP